MIACVLHSRVRFELTHLVQLLYPPDQQWVTGRVLKINIICRGTVRRRRWNRESGSWKKERKKERREKVSVSGGMSSKHSGWFPVRPHDSFISRYESATQMSIKCWLNSVTLMLWTQNPPNGLLRPSIQPALPQPCDFFVLFLHSPLRHVLLFACMMCFCLCGWVWEAAQALPRMCDFTMHSSVCACGSWHRFRPIGGLALTRTSP